MKRVFSGIQPTGNLHLGNHLGAIRNWVELQSSYDCIYCVVDLHALTLPHDPEEFRQNTREVAAGLLAAGLDPDRCVMFNQSQVNGHPALAWILNCLTPLGWLNRMTQFKEKAGKDRESAGLGLYAYPVLMTADVLVHKATHVPVGEDQKQHLELARDIAAAFNRHYGVDYFTLPEPLIYGEGARVMSLRDGTKKMSKSDPSDYSRINLTDDPDTVARKFQKAKTDSYPGVTYEPERRPEATNLLGIYAALAGITREEVCARFETAQFSAFKRELTDLAVVKLGPVGTEMRRLMQDPGYIDGILRRGAERARETAAKHLAEIQDIVGFLRP
ncbi:MAG: tryptophan--tRNA ligase [Alphaproteobacteria bacterium]